MKFLAHLYLFKSCPQSRYGSFLNRHNLECRNYTIFERKFDGHFLAGIEPAKQFIDRIKENICY